MLSKEGARGLSVVAKTNLVATRNTGSSYTGALRRGKRRETFADIVRRVPMSSLRPLLRTTQLSAAKRLGICSTTLKKLCRHYGIARWPFRQLSGLHGAYRGDIDPFDPMISFRDDAYNAGTETFQPPKVALCRGGENKNLTVINATGSTGSLTPQPPSAYHVTRPVQPPLHASALPDRVQTPMTCHGVPASTPIALESARVSLPTTSVSTSESCRRLVLSASVIGPAVMTPTVARTPTSPRAPGDVSMLSPSPSKSFDLVACSGIPPLRSCWPRAIYCDGSAEALAIATGGVPLQSAKASSGDSSLLPSIAGCGQQHVVASETPSPAAVTRQSCGSPWSKHACAPNEIAIITGLGAAPGADCGAGGGDGCGSARDGESDIAEVDFEVLQEIFSSEVQGNGALEPTAEAPKMKT